MVGAARPGGPSLASHIGWGTAPLLRLERFSQRFPNGRGVGPIDLEVAPGIHGLLGPNGSGKTTLLKTLLGFHASTGGRAQVLGFDVATQGLMVRRQVGYMPENDVFVPGLNASQTVRLAAELCGLSPSRAHEAAAEALQAVGLGAEAFHAPHRLSTGQRQKMKLAAALVHAPRLLVLDEPTNGLDPTARRRMLELIRELSSEKGISIILSTHVLPDVEAVCSDAVLLRDGLLVGVESVGDRRVLLTGKSTWFSADVLGDPESFIRACRAARLAVVESSGRLRVAAPDAARVLEAANSAGVLLTRLVPATVGVEDAILEKLEAGA